MARIRTIKPTFFTSLTIANLTLEQRLTFIGLWTHVDDEGRCIYDPRLIKAALWPLDSRTAEDVDGDIRALTESSLITHYTLSERSYLQVNGWSEHQRVNRKTPSTFPPPEVGQIVDVSAGQQALTEGSVRTHGAITEGSRQEGKGREGKGKEERTGSASDAATEDPVEQRVTKAAYEHCGKAFNFIATRQIVKWALHTRGEKPQPVHDAVIQLYEMGKPITKQTLGQYLDGHIGKRPGARPAPSADTYPVAGSPEWRELTTEQQVQITEWRRRREAAR